MESFKGKGGYEIPVTELIVTLPLRVILPQIGRIDVSGRTGSIDVGTGDEKKPHFLDASAFIDVTWPK